MQKEPRTAQVIEVEVSALSDLLIKVTELETRHTELQKRNTEYHDENVALKVRVKELEELVKKSSRPSFFGHIIESKGE